MRRRRSSDPLDTSGFCPLNEAKWERTGKKAEARPAHLSKDRSQPRSPRRCFLSARNSPARPQHLTSSVSPAVADHDAGNENLNVPEAPPPAPRPLPFLPSHLSPWPSFQNMSPFITGDIAGRARLERVMIFSPRRPPQSAGGAERDESSAAYQAIYYPARLPARHSAV